MIHVFPPRSRLGINVITPYLFDQDKFSTTQPTYNGQMRIEKFPLAPFLKTIDFVWCLGLTLANMGPYSQATRWATKFKMLKAG
jgi:hypothetical protein